jgi:mono/diheme cytochrome c family protein
MRKTTTYVLGIIGFLLLGGFVTGNQEDEPVTVWETLIRLGHEPPKYYVENLDPVLVKKGYELVYNGRTKSPTGGMSNYISPYFVCTDCHNQVQEEPVLTNFDPQARLEYAVAKDIPFLQSTTFWGITNRESWYNGDYYLKYDTLVDKARNDVYEATQLCSKKCSSGRYIEQWEWEAINEYYWSLQIKLADLNLTAKEMQRVMQGMKDPKMDKALLIDMLKRKYAQASPADFVDVPENKEKGYDTAPGDPANGELIWDKSCKTCHRYGGPSQLVLDDARVTFKKFKKEMTKDSKFSLYEIIRHGTYAEAGHQQYMPLYTADRMSNQQVEDLRAYIELKAKRR